MTAILAGISGLIMGLGLIVSGMANPAKVLGFLDIAGSWDPSLAFVMGGAVLVGLLAFTWARRLESAWNGARIAWPSATAIDGRLLVGSILFGIGWGMAGICPGPALVLVGGGWGDGILFAVSMAAGMVLFGFWQKRHPG